MSVLSPSNTPDIWVTPKELAEYWRVSRRTVYRLLAKRSLPFRRVGNQIRVNVEDALAHGHPEEPPCSHER